jgi:ABC-type lipopolysaccharide export system ATPase subunit
MTTPLLKIEHLTMRFGGLVAVNDLSFDVHKGEITALIGPNVCMASNGFPRCWGWLTGPHEAVPTTPMTSVGTPVMKPGGF